MLRRPQRLIARFGTAVRASALFRTALRTPARRRVTTEAGNSAASEASAPQPSKARVRAAQLVLVGLPLAFFIESNVVTVVAIGEEQLEMAPALRPHDVALVWRWDGPQYARGDAVLLRSPTEPRRRVVRRLVGKPNDTVHHKDDLITIPPGRCWLEADAALHSRKPDPAVARHDSCALGPLPIALIEGSVKCVVWPPERAGRVARESALVLDRLTGWR